VKGTVGHTAEQRAARELSRWRTGEQYSSKGARSNQKAEVVFGWLMMGERLHIRHVIGPRRNLQLPFSNLVAHDKQVRRLVSGGCLNKSGGWSWFVILLYKNTHRHMDYHEENSGLVWSGLLCFLDRKKSRIARRQLRPDTLTL